MPPFQPGPARRPWQPALPVSGGTPLQPPLVTAVGVNNLTATGVNLIGSVNPQGLSGTWWFVYGTTPQFGSSTTPAAISATSIPQTFTTTLSGLATGATYYFAIVASTAGGTVTSAPITFVPAAPNPVTDATNPLPSTSAPAVGVPHRNYPVTFSPTVGVGVVEQGTLDEVFANVQMLAVCPQGACPELPSFGVPSLVFGQAPLDPSPVIAAIQQQEPRATETALSQGLGDPDYGSWLIALTTRYAGGDR